MQESKIKLDIGAITASQEDGRSFLLFLYQEGGGRCLTIPLAPSDLHALLTNVAPKREERQKKGNTIYDLFAQGLSRSGLQLQEVELVRGEQENSFSTLLKLSEGEAMEASFADGIIMAKICSAPIFVGREVMERYALSSNMDAATLLKHQLKEAVKREDFEEAYLIQQRLERMNG